MIEAMLMAGGSMGIKSHQTISLDDTYGTGSFSITINSVDPEKTIVVVETAAEYASQYACVHLAAPDRLDVYRKSSIGTGKTIIKIIELSSGVRVIRGFRPSTGQGTTSNYDIGATVDPAKCLTFVSGGYKYSAGNEGPEVNMNASALRDSTTIQIYRGKFSAGDNQVSWQVAEFS